MIIRSRNNGILFLLLPMLTAPVSVFSATVINVKVTVVETPSCVINDNQPIEVDFGEIVMNRINGENYERKLDYSLVCTGNSRNNLKMQIIGAEAESDNVHALLKSSTEGLGIAIKNNGNNISINDWFNFNYPEAPLLTAVPVKTTEQELNTGEFTASATMKVEYQ